MNKDDLLNKEAVKETAQKIGSTLNNKVFTKKNFKKLGVCVILCGILAGGGGYFVHQQKIAHKAEVNTARIAIATAEAAKKNQTLLPESQVRSIAAQAIGQDEMYVTFREISLDYDHDYDDRYDDHDDHDKHDRHNKYDRRKNNGRTDADTHATDTRRRDNSAATAYNPVYKVKCYANNVKYKVYIDAVNGDVLRCKVDD